MISQLQMAIGFCTAYQTAHMYRKVLFNNFHFDIYGTIDYNLKNKTLAKNRSTVDQKRLRQINNVDCARPSPAHETAWQTREDPRGREESIFPFL